MKLLTLTASCITVASILLSTEIASAQPKLSKSPNVNPTTVTTTNGQMITTVNNTFMSRSTPNFNVQPSLNITEQRNVKLPGIHAVRTQSNISTPKKKL